MRNPQLFAPPRRPERPSAMARVLLTIAVSISLELTSAMLRVAVSTSFELSLALPTPFDYHSTPHRGVFFGGLHEQRSHRLHDAR
jgi:hypothetical protein